MPGVSHFLTVAAVAVPFAFTDAFVEGWVHPKWALVFGFALLALIATFSRGQSLRFPRLSVGEFVILSLFGLTTTFLLFRFRPFNWQGPLLDRLTYWTLVFSSASAFATDAQLIRKLRCAISAAGAGVAGVELIQYALTPIQPGVEYFAFASTFGHVNMTAQFLGLAMLSALFEMPVVTSQMERGLLRAATVIMGAGIGVALCRSVDLALLGSALVAMLLLPTARAGLRRQARSYGALVIAMIFLAATAWSLRAVAPKQAQDRSAPSQIEIPSPTADLGETRLPIDSQALAEKSGNVSFRKELAQAAWDMIRDRPLGFGPGGFELSSIPYRSQPSENHIDRSPHNEFLRFAVEDGVLTTLAGVLLLLSWLVSIGRLARSSSDPGEQNRAAFLAVTGVFFLVEALFQFPIENPFPFFWSAVLLGIGLVMIRGTSSVAPVWTRVVAIGLLVPLALLTQRFVVSSMDVAAGERGDLARATRACDRFPSYWRGCSTEAFLELKSRDYAAVAATTRKMLDMNPDNVVALRLRGTAMFGVNDPAEACRSIRRYVEIYKGRTLLRERLAQACADQKG